MRRILGKMSVHHLFDWRNRVGDTVQETIEAFLKDGEVGEHVAARWIERSEERRVGKECW